jgi:hypothetical protein
VGQRLVGSSQAAISGWQILGNSSVVQGEGIAIMCNAGAEVCIRVKMWTSLCKSKSLHVKVVLGERMREDACEMVGRRLCL